MTDQINDGLIAIYDDAAHAMLDFDSLVAFDTGVPFDAAVSTKSATGEIEILRSHHADGHGHHERKVRHEEHEQFLKMAKTGMDEGEALLAVICPPRETERFDHLLTDARRVLQVDVSHLPD